MSEPANDLVLPLLDTIETSVGEPPPNTLRDHVLRFHRAEMISTRSVYVSLPGRNPERRIEALDNCKKNAWFVRNVDTGMVKVVSSSCKLRWCPMCSNARKYHLAGQVTEWLEGVAKPKFLTMTLKHTAQPLAEQIDHLYNSFRKFRMIKEHKKKIKGGVWFFQIKKSKKDNLWHPHLHCVIDSKWIDGKKLWRTWLKITGTSKVIDIRAVKDPDKVAEYVARYSARPSDLAVLGAPDQLELVTALHGRRLVGTWGTAREMSLSPSKPPDADRWRKVGSWWTVASLFAIDDRARNIWSAFKLNKPMAIEDDLYYVEQQWLGTAAEVHCKKKEAWQSCFEFM